MNVQDSVVSGDVNITQNLASSQSCNNCNSTGAVQTACISCKQIAYCGVCSESVAEQRITLVCEGWGRSSSNLLGRLCDSCFNEEISDDTKYATVECCKSRSSLIDNGCMKCMICSKSYNATANDCGDGKKAWDFMYMFDPELINLPYSPYIHRLESDRDSYHIYQDLLKDGDDRLQYSEQFGIAGICTNHIVFPSDYKAMCIRFHQGFQDTPRKTSTRMTKWEGLDPNKGAITPQQYDAIKKNFSRIRWAD